MLGLHVAQVATASAFIKFCIMRATNREILNYTTALSHLLGLADLERMVDQTSFRSNSSLTIFKTFMQRLGNPETCAPVVHIAGTKGKGSTCAIVTAILAAAGYRVGLFSSPHLYSFRERIRIGLNPISERDFSTIMSSIWPYVAEMKSCNQPITTFELLTALAFQYFKKQQVDIQVLETGLGGRLDATNIVPQSTCAITSLSLDHTDVLGDTIEEIATEKAGIIKEGSPVITAPQCPSALKIIEKVCVQRNAKLIQLGKDILYERLEFDYKGQFFSLATQNLEPTQYWTPLLGKHQVENAAVALTIIDQLESSGFTVSPEVKSRGLASVVWPGRIQVLGTRPFIVVDCAHNPHSIQKLCTAIKDHFSYDRLLLIIGTSINKDLSGMIKELAPFTDHAFASFSDHPRALSPRIIYRELIDNGIPATLTTSAQEAIALATKSLRSSDLLIVTGSVFIAAEAIRELHSFSEDLFP